MSSDAAETNTAEKQIVQSKKIAEIETRIYRMYKDMVLPDLKKEKKSLIEALMPEK